MKNLFLTSLSLIVCIFIFTNNSMAQRTCGSHEHMLEQMANDPEMRSNRAKLENFTRSFVRDSKSNPSEVRTIPVYVHVLYKTTQENISDAQIESQISVLNEDFNANNFDLSNVPSDFESVTSDMEIQFELISISRNYVNRTEWGTSNDMKAPSQGGVAPITPNTHMNIWVCNIGGGILGYAQFPGGSSATDGVVISPQYFGSSDYSNNFNLSAPYDKGRTATHEVGHYLNLYHIWGDGPCSASDEVNDTPSAEAPNYGCPNHPSYSCSSADMFMNYMDYVEDECMFMFSEDQKTRVLACLNSSRANLGNTTNDDYCTSNSQYPSNTMTPNNEWQTRSGIYAGEYSVFSVENGETYIFSLCESDGGSASYDSQLILRKNSDGSFLEYSDDDCGDDPKIIWEATFTGEVRALINEYNCQTNSTSTTIAYKKDGGSSNTTINVIGSINAVSYPSSVGSHTLVFGQEKNISFTIENISNQTQTKYYKLYLTTPNGSFVDQVWHRYLTLNAGESMTINRNTVNIGGSNNGVYTLGTEVATSVGNYKLELRAGADDSFNFNDGDGTNAEGGYTVACQSSGCNPQAIEIIEEGGTNPPDDDYCTSNSQYPSGTMTPNNEWQTRSGIYAGEYSVFYVEEGETYIFSLCESDGGSASYDSQLILRKNSDGSFLEYSDDDCGDDPKITWTSTFTGEVRTLINEYNCETNSTSTTIAYKKDGGSSNDCDPPTVSLSSPSNNSSFSVNETINFSWSANGNACSVVNYEFWLSSPDGTENTSELTNTEGNLNTSDMIEGIWSWGIKAENNEGVWSERETRSFVIESEEESCNDPLENNDDYSNAYNIGNSSNYSNENLCLTAGDEDWFKFIYDGDYYYFKVIGYSASVEGDYAINFSRSGSDIQIETMPVSGSDNIDTKLYLYDTDHTTQLVYDDDGGSSYFSLINHSFADSPYLTVSPSSLNFSASSGSASASVSTNVSNWSVTDNANWLTVTKSGNNINITYQTNTSTSERPATISINAPGVSSQTISVTQAGANSYLTVNPTSLNFNASSGSASASVSTNVSNWSVTDNANWLTVTKSGNNINITYQANTSTSERPATISINAPGVSSQTISVTQTGANSYLTVNPTSLNFSASSGTASAIVNTNISNWSVTDDANWITVTKSGNNINITYQANTSTNPRTATIDVSGSGITETISVTQTGAVITDFVNISVSNIEASPSEIDVPILIELDNYYELYETVGAIQMTLNYDATSGVHLTGDYELTNRTQGFTATINVNENGVNSSATVLLYSMSGASISPNTGEILKIFFNVDGNAVENSNTCINLNNVLVSDVVSNSLPVNHTEEFCIFIAEQFAIGDINEDGNINIFDLQILINVILNNDNNSGHIANSDLNDDGNVNIFDLQALINLILGNNSKSLFSSDGLNTITLPSLELTTNSVGEFYIKLNNEDNISAFELEFTYDNSLGFSVSSIDLIESLNAFDISYTTTEIENNLTKVKIIAYTMSMNTIPNDIRELIKITYETNNSAILDLSFLSAIFTNQDLENIDVTTVNGQFVINEDNTFVSNPEKSKISIYPNPAKDKLFVSGNVENANLKIFNLQSQLVLEKVLTDDKTIDISKLEIGLYTVKIQTKNNIFINKLIKK